MDRNAAVELAGRIVENLAARLVWRGQKTFVEKDDLTSVGMVQALRTIDTHSEAAGFPLDKSIVRDAKTAMIRFIQKEAREWRYRERGNEKAIRDTEAGNQPGDVDGESSAALEDGFPEPPEWGDFHPGAAKIPPSVRLRDFANSDGFQWPAWLRGSINMARETVEWDGQRSFLYRFPELDENCEMRPDYRNALLSLAPVARQCTVDRVGLDAAPGRALRFPRLDQVKRWTIPRGTIDDLKSRRRTYANGASWAYRWNDRTRGNGHFWWVEQLDAVAWKSHFSRTATPEWSGAAVPQYEYAAISRAGRQLFEQPKKQKRSDLFSREAVPVRAAAFKVVCVRRPRASAARRRGFACTYPLYGRLAGEFCNRPAHINGLCCAHWNLINKI